MNGPTVTRLSGLLGAKVEGDLGQLLDPGNADVLQQALWSHHVLVFPRVDPTPDQHVALSRVFGTPAPPEQQNVSHPDHDEITVFDSRGGYKADQWHTDATFRADVPRGAVLCMRERPSVGGDTVFASCTAAYDALSGGMKKLLDRRRARHDIAPDVGTEHPVVVAHPITGRPSLFVNRIFTRRIVNLPEDESAAVLPFLLNHVSRPEFTYRHTWQDGDVVVWDNWSTQHYALFDYEEPRTVHRVALVGQPLEAASLP